MINSDNNTGYEPVTLSLIIPLDDFYTAVTPRDRSLVESWLKNMVSPYSIAMVVVANKIMTGQYNHTALEQVYEWLATPADRAVAINYTLNLAQLLEIYVIPMLYQEGINLDNVTLVGSEEMTLSEWSNGYATLTFNVYPNGSTRTIIGTPHPIFQPSPPQTLPNSAQGQVYPGGVPYSY